MPHLSARLARCGSGVGTRVCGPNRHPSMSLEGVVTPRPWQCEARCQGPMLAVMALTAESLGDSPRPSEGRGCLRAYRWSPQAHRQRSKSRELCQPDPFCLRTPHLRPAGLGRWHDLGQPTRLRSCCALADILLSLVWGTGLCPIFASVFWGTELCPICSLDVLPHTSSF